MASRRRGKKKEKKRRKRPDTFQRIRKKMKESGAFGGDEVTILPGGAEKMSEVLVSFMQPYLHLVENREQYELLTSLAIIAWNTALLPKSRQKGIIDEIHAQLKLADRKVESFKRIMADMIERKREHFADNGRFIIEYDISESKHGHRLSVVSTPANDSWQSP